MTEPKDQRIMVVMAHPDDAEFACGGSVAKWTAEGHEVVYVVCTNGDKGSSDPEMTSERLTQIREGEQRAAAAVLGVKEVVFLRHPDGGLEDTPAFRGQIVRLLRQYRPFRVVTMEPLRWYRRFIHHRDHRVCGQVTLDAVFPYARDRLHYPEHLAEGLPIHKVAEVYLSGSEEADTRIDISDVIELKFKALQCHVTQVGKRPVAEFEERLRQMAALAGAPANLPLAEAFCKIELRF